MKTLYRNSSLIVLGAIYLCSFLPSKDYLLGEWRNKKHGVEVNIYKKKNLYFGKVTDAGNEKGNEKIRNGEVMQILQNFRKTSDTTYCCGTIYIPKINSTLKARIEIIDKNKLQVIGYVFGIPMVSKWTKID